MKQNPLTYPLKLLAITTTVFSVASACTLLHLTHNTYAENLVDIEIVEVSDDGSGNLTPWQDVENAMPNTTYSAIPQVINRGTTDVNVRVCLARSGQNNAGEPINVTNEHISVTLESGWTKEPDAECYNYNQVLAAGAITDPLFSSISINDLKDEHQNATFNLHIYAEATGDIPITPDSPDTGSSTTIAKSAIALGFGAIIAIIGTIVFRRKSSK